MFLAAVSGGLVALGPMATATHLGNAFYAFGLILLPTLYVWMAGAGDVLPAPEAEFDEQE